MIGNENIASWEQFKALEITEQVQIINDLLAQGHSIPEISSSITGMNGSPLNRTAIAKLFERHGYVRNGNMFIHDPNREVPKQKSNTKKVTDSYKTKTNEVTPSHKSKTNEVTSSYTSQFTQEEYEILQRVIKEQRLRDNVNNSIPVDAGECMNRNVRVYTRQYGEFAEFCKANNLKQADALYNAINDFMGKYKG